MMYVNRNIRIHHDEKAPGYMFLHYLYVQVLPDGGNTSQETDTHAYAQRYRNQEMEHLIYRQEIQETAEYHKTVHHVIQCVIIQGIDQSQRYRSSDQSDQHTFQHKRRTHEKVRCTDIFHNIDLFRSHRDTDGYCIADQEMLTASRITIIPMDT